MSIVMSWKEREVWMEWFRSLKEYKSMRELVRKTKKISKSDKKFALRFDKKIRKAGYCFNFSREEYDEDGWYEYIEYLNGAKDYGDYVIEYCKPNRKPVVIINIDIDNGKVTFCFNISAAQIKRNRDYIEHTPDCVKSIFTNSYWDCGTIASNLCKIYSGNKKDNCEHKKWYTIDNREIVKCKLKNFTLLNPVIGEIPLYVDLVKTVCEFRT